MPVQPDWLVPQRLIYVRASGAVTFSELAAANQSLEQEVTEDGPIYHALADLTDVTRIEIGIGDLRAFYRAQSIPANYGWTITVQPNGLQRFFASLATQFANIEAKQVITIEEGLDFLVQRDPQLGSYHELLLRYVDKRREMIHALRRTQSPNIGPLEPLS